MIYIDNVKYKQLEYSSNLDSLLEYIRLNILAKPSTKEECLNIMESQIIKSLNCFLYNNDILYFDVKVEHDNFYISIKENHYSPIKNHIYSFEITFDEKIDEWIYNATKKIHEEIDLKIENILNK